MKRTYAIIAPDYLETLVMGLDSQQEQFLKLLEIHKIIDNNSILCFDKETKECVHFNARI